MSAEVARGVSEKAKSNEWGEGRRRKYGVDVRTDKLAPRNAREKKKFGYAYQHLDSIVGTHQEEGVR